ncbi:MAG: acyltransferase family protein [Acidimicrobiales bacterium]
MTSATSPVRPLPRTAETPGRDLLIDLARAGALGIVVVWHWVFTTIRFGADGPHVGNPVGVTPGMWLATWVLQPMPIFFAIGGVLHARSLRHGSEGFRRRRMRRLLVPALPLIGPAALLMAGAAVIGRGDVVASIVLIISPMWFLAVYMALVALAPLAWRGHLAAPRLTLAAMVGGAALLDVARFGLGWGGPLMTVACFTAVWAVVHQLGFHVDALRASGAGRRIAVAVGGLAALAVAVAVGPYPAAMVGVPGERVSNMAPPTFAVILLAVFQLGLLAAAAGPVERFAARHREGLVWAGRWSMTVFVWHLLAWVGFYLLQRACGGQVGGDVTGTWWLARPLWLVGPAVVAVPLCVVTARFDPTSRRAAGQAAGRATGVIS